MQPEERKKWELINTKEKWDVVLLLRKVRLFQMNNAFGLTKRPASNISDNAENTGYKQKNCAFFKS